MKRRRLARWESHDKREFAELFQQDKAWFLLEFFDGQKVGAAVKWLLPDEENSQSEAYLWGDTYLLLSREGRLQTVRVEAWTD